MWLFYVNAGYIPSGGFGSEERAEASNPTPDLIAIRYLESLQKIADGQATKIFLPYEASSFLSSIAGIGEMLKK